MQEERLPLVYEKCTKKLDSAELLFSLFDVLIAVAIIWSIENPYNLEGGDTSKHWQQSSIYN